MANNIYSQLASIQKSLKAPKGKRNSFGNYNYRSCEDILEAVKPLLDGCALTIADDMVEIGGRIYVKATATLANTDGQSVSTTAFAREEESKKGMDVSQVTGSTSSYARKYALNGLFAIDDTKDADTDEYAKVTTSKPANINDAYKEINNAKDVKDLTAAWKKWSAAFPKGSDEYEKVKTAISLSPLNPENNGTK